MTDPTLDPENPDEDLFDFGSVNPTVEGVFADEGSKESAESVTADLDAALELTEQDLGLSDEFENPFDFDSITADWSASADQPAAANAAAMPVSAAPLPVGSAQGTAPSAAPGTTERAVVLATSKTQLALAAMVALNLLLVGLSWRSQGSTRDLLEGLATAPAPTEEGTARDTAPRERRLDLPLIDNPRAEGYETLDEAQRAIEHGEFQVAREMLYALLAVIDRVEDTARYDVEARAAFLLGDAYRMEAEALASASEGTEGDQL